jgi:hypothetical protein
VVAVDEAAKVYLPSARVSRASPPPDAVVHVLDRVVLTGEATAFAASVSDFRWTQVGGPTVDLEPFGSELQFRPAQAGTYVFDLVVTDSTNLSSLPRRLSVPVVPAGVGAESVHAGPDFTTTESAVVIEGAAADLDRSLGFPRPAAFSWSQVAGHRVPLHDPSTLKPSFTAPASGVYVFELRAAVGKPAVLLTSRRTVAVSLPQNPLPVTVLEERAQAGSLVLDGTGSSPEDLRFSFLQTEGLPTVLHALDSEGARGGVLPRSPPGLAPRAIERPPGAGGLPLAREPALVLRGSTRCLRIR